MKRKGKAMFGGPHFFADGASDILKGTAEGGEVIDLRPNVGHGVPVLNMPELAHCKPRAALENAAEVFHR